MTQPLRRAIVASPTAPAQAAVADLQNSADWVDFDDADYVIALGGDGFMLQTLHRMLERRRGPVPVFGMNLGTVGFLMNEWRSYGLEDRLARAKPFRVTPLQMTATGIDGRVHQLPAINEVSLLRETRQTAKLESRSTAASSYPNWPVTESSPRPRQARPPIISRHRVRSCRLVRR